MGDQNTASRRISKAEGVAGQGIVSQGPGVAEKWGGKLEWTLNKLLLGGGVGNPPTEIAVPVGATKEFTTPPYYNTGDFDESASRDSIRLDGVGEDVWYVFTVPHDFTSITDAVVIVFCASTEVDQDLDIASQYGAIGEVFTTHTEADAASTYGFTANVLTEIDVSGILSVLAASDHVKIKLTWNETNALLIQELRFKYS